MHSATRHPGGEEQSNNKPKGVRTWTWLVLCDDGELRASIAYLYVLSIVRRYCHFDLRKSIS